MQGNCWVVEVVVEVVEGSLSTRMTDFRLGMREVGRVGEGRRAERRGMLERGCL